MGSRKLVAFLGAEGSGKSYNSKKLVEEHNFKKLSFADALREMAFKIIGMDFEEGMKHYAELKQTEIVNGQNFRNILENLGSAIRQYTEDFWVDVVIKKISETSEDICIDDMRYTNEFIKVYNYCQKEEIEFKAYFCNYHSDVFRSDNPHESAKLANYLYSLNYKDLQEINIDDIITYKKEQDRVELRNNLVKKLNELEGQGWIKKEDLQ